ncbi:phosphoribosylanthranilate isomerase [Ancylobacter defluvii]|uniref:N-(5'-phosphoribosyl)anthranilate isomerase n=1 Tax=Ancylobacter defluvii TaxID=1282440 RepID=A0A9W6JVD4_9HYPH|nr:phosphoribosylanthranilate isomerase [Ancylobacter defluvii]MBS7590336.1 phosphoribosylanthranilate isomerase [Ancylobacter defluvii]GLK83253.1 N-(5'-phosphoribosyl)anthranilate isomerase [Ancylobacter defluvii]
MAIEIKICGLKTPETLDAALAAGADMVGAVFFAPSPRHLDLATAAQLGARARGKAQIVALSVDADDAALADIIAALAPDALQLHGSETPERVAAVKARFGRPVWKAIGIAGPEDLAKLPAYAAVADRLLLDAKAPKGAALPGGNGVPFDWNLLAGLDLAKPFMLSGGLTPENVGQALAITRARAVDVSSGVESAPGVKDPARIAAFVRHAREAAHDVARAYETAAAGPPADHLPAAPASPANLTSSTS